MSTFNLSMSTDQIQAEFYIQGTSGGPAVGNIAVLNLNGNAQQVLRGDGTFGAGAGGGSANVAGANGQLQYNNDGNLGAITGVTTNGTKLTVNTIANLSITGGSNGQALFTDGSGNLTFATVPGYVQLPRLEFVAPTPAATNPTFTHPSFAYYGNDATKMQIFKSGVLSDKERWSLVDTVLTYNGLLTQEAQIDILPQTVAVANTDMSGNINAFDITCNSISGDGSGLTNIPGGYQISNGTTNVKTFSTGNITATVNGTQMISVDTSAVEFNGKLLPKSNITYDLGSSTRRWKDLYLSNNTIILGDANLSTVGGTLSVSGDPVIVAPGNVITIDRVVANTISVAGSNIGNIASVTLDGNAGNVLTGTGTWQTLPVVGNIATINLDGNTNTYLNGSGGFVNIAIPTYGNVANLNLNGNAQTVLLGNGVFSNVLPASGNAYELQWSGSSNTLTSSNRYYIGANGSGSISASRDTVGAGFASYQYSNTVATGGGIATARARGTQAAPIAVAVGDAIGGLQTLAYTGNGTTTLDGVAGWVSTGGVFANVTALPLSTNGRASSNVQILTTNATSNTISTVASFNADVSTRLYGNVIMANTSPPATATSTGTVGQIAWDATYIYMCTATNTWKRSQLTTW